MVINSFSKQFEQELLANSDSANREYILSGIAEGFRVGYSNSGKLLRSSKPNLKSASLHPEVIDKYQTKEMALNRVAGPFPVQSFGRRIATRKFYSKSVLHCGYTLSLDISYYSKHSLLL